MRTNKNRIKKRIKRECWNLDDTFYNWLLEHLRVYLKDASIIIDLDYRTLTVNGVSRTQKEAIKHVIKQIEKILFIKDSLPTELIAKGYSLGSAYPGVLLQGLRQAHLHRRDHRRHRQPL